MQELLKDFGRCLEDNPKKIDFEDKDILGSMKKEARTLIDSL